MKIDDASSSRYFATVFECARIQYCNSEFSWSVKNQVIKTDFAWHQETRNT